MIARKSDSLRAQEVLEAISETNERIKAFDITEDQFLHADEGVGGLPFDVCA